MTNLIWIFIIIFPLLGFWNYGLFDLDEGFYAAVTAEMIKNKQYIIPTYQGIPWFEKPILLYWITTLSIYSSLLLPYLFISILPFTLLLSHLKSKWNNNLLRRKYALYTITSFLVYFFILRYLSLNQTIICSQLSEFALRLPSFLSILGLYGGIYYWTKRWTNINTALAAVLICSTSILTVAIGKLMLTDALYTCFFTNALLSYYNAIAYNPKSKIWTGAFLGFAMLAKGPVAPFLFGLIVLITHLLMPLLNRRTYWVPSIIAFLTIISFWYIPVYLTMPETFWSEFIVNQNIKRFLGGDKAHRVNNIFVSFIYYIPILFIGLFPWSIKLKKSFQNSSPLLNYLKIWIITIFAFFTLSQSKLPHYIFPCIPPLAVLLGVQTSISDIRSKKFLLIRAFHALILFGITQTFFTLWYTKFHPQEMITRKVVLDLNHFYIPTKMKNLPISNYYWYDSENIQKGPFNMSLTSHPSASFYKLFGHKPIQHKYLQNQAIFQTKNFESLKTPCALITRGKPDTILSIYLDINNVQTYTYCYPKTQDPYITVYIVNSKQHPCSTINPDISPEINSYVD